MIRGITWTHKISLESFRSFRGPLFHKPVTGQEFFFNVSYSKPALKEYHFRRNNLLSNFPWHVLCLQKITVHINVLRGPIRFLCMQYKTVQKVPTKCLSISFCVGKYQSSTWSYLKAISHFCAVSLNQK